MNFLGNLFGGGMQAMAGMQPDQMGVPDQMGGVNQALGQNQAMGQQQQQGGMFRQGGGLRNVLGIIGDALLVQSGHAPMYGPQMRQKRMGQALSNYLGKLDPGLADIIAENPEMGMQLYKMQHPDAKEPPAIVQEYLWRQHLPENERGGYDKYVESRKFNPFGTPITLGPGDRYEPSGGAPEAEASGEVTATGPNGEKVRFNQQTGQWEPAGGATDQPSPTFPGQ